MYYYNYETSVGPICITCDDTHILSITQECTDNFENRETALIKECQKQIVEYLDGKRKEFDLPLLIRGTEFECKVYKEMIAIGYGQTKSYKQLASASGHPKAYRAVGSVCAKNPYVIVVPCHRVLKSDQGLGGYAFGVKMKEKLLALEGNKVEKQRIL